MKYPVHETFYSIQTEGVLAGRPAYFIRLYGCNLKCSWCDTPQKKKDFKLMSVKKLVKKIRQECPGHFVVITGGEPFLHDLWPLTEAIIRMGLYVQIETNGTKDPGNFVMVPKSTYVVVSPKTKKIHPWFEEHALCFKYVIRKGELNKKDGLPKGIYRTHNPARIMVSPCFEKSKKRTKENIATTLEVCKYFGYYLSIQYHKIISDCYGVPFQ